MVPNYNIINAAVAEWSFRNISLQYFKGIYKISVNYICVLFETLNNFCKEKQMKI